MAKSELQKALGDLNAKQATFAREYQVDKNATQACIRAGYSKKTASSQGSQLVSHPKIARALAAFDAERDREIEFAREKYLADLEQARELAMAQDKPEAAISATNSQARITGDFAPTRTEASIEGKGLEGFGSFMALQAAFAGAINEEKALEDQERIALEAREIETSEVSAGRPQGETPAGGSESVG